MYSLQVLPFSPTDMLTFFPIIALMIVLFVLSNREARKSLEKSRTAEELLTADRDMLRLRLDKSMQDLKESRLMRMNELTKAAEFGRLSQGIIHDLMTPLTSIILHTEKLRENTATQKSLEKAVAASNRMAEYMKDIRATLSREETEKMCTVSDELEGVLHLLAYKARTEDVSIQVIQDGLCLWHGNPLKLRQLFSNVISNALDSFEGIEDGRKKKIEIVIQKNSKDHIIKINDNGSGIPRGNLEKIFDPFFTTKSLDKGTGIGLSTVKSIVEKDLKGMIGVESHEGMGSTFTITFPMQYIDHVAYPQPRHTPPHRG